MKRIYNQENSANHFQLEYKLAECSQGYKFIQEYYFSFMNLWIEFIGLVYATVPNDSLVAM